MQKHSLQTDGNQSVTKSNYVHYEEYNYEIMIARFHCRNSKYIRTQGLS